jgi:hypothetical protein
MDQLKRLITVLGSHIEPLRKFEWQGPTEDQFFGLIQRAALVRQWEAIHAQVALSEAGYGAFGVSMLRAGYEELIWLEYLLTIPDDASLLLRLMSAGGAAKSVVQQEGYLGPEVAHRIGFPPSEVDFHERNGKAVDKRLKELGKRLGWPKATPSFRWLSTAVGREKEYDFLYHGTSSFVHFSPHELMRRIWGSRGSVTIGSGTFASYWEEFGAYWSARNFINLMVACVVWEQEAEEEPTELLKIAEALVPVPIITPTELGAWSEQR